MNLRLNLLAEGWNVSWIFNKSMTDAPKRIHNWQYISLSNDKMIVLILVSHLAGKSHCISTASPVSREIKFSVKRLSWAIQKFCQILKKMNKKWRYLKMNLRLNCRAKYWIMSWILKCMKSMCALKTEKTSMNILCGYSGKFFWCFVVKLPSFPITPNKANLKNNDGISFLLLHTVCMLKWAFVYVLRIKVVKGMIVRMQVGLYLEDLNS